MNSLPRSQTRPPLRTGTQVLPATTPPPDIAVVSIEPTRTELSSLLALLTIRFSGLDLHRCRLVQLPEGKYDILPPQLVFYNPQTDKRQYTTLAQWPSAWRVKILPLAVRAWDEANGDEVSN